MSRTTELLRPLADRGYRLLWGAQVLSEVGDWAARLALVVLVVERTGSATWAGAAVGASLVAWLGPGQLVAAAVDAVDRRAVMVVADLVRAVAFALLLLPAPAVVTVLLAAVAGLAAPAFHGARSAAQVELVAPERYGSSVALGGVTQDATVLLGYLLGGLALGVADPSTALALNAATFVASAALLRGLGPVPARAPGHAEGDDGGRGPARERLREATQVLLDDAVVRRAVALTLVATFSATASETLLVVYAVRDLGGAGWVAPVLLAATTGITLVGTARVAVTGTPSALLRTTALLTAVPAAAVVALAGAGLLAARSLSSPAGSSPTSSAAAVVTAAAFVLAGLLFVATTPANVVGGPRLPQHLRAVAISVVVGATTGGQALAAVVGGGLADRLPVHAGLAVVMLPAVVVGAWYLARPLPQVPDGPTTARVPSPRRASDPAPVTAG